MSDEEDNVIAFPRDAEADTTETEPVAATADQETPSAAPIIPENPVDELLEIGDRQTEIDERPPTKWAQPVDGAALADTISDYLSDFVVLPRHADTILTMVVF